MVQNALANLNIEKLNPMQEAALAADMQQDLIVLAPTGSGKTLAYLLPVLQILEPNKEGIQALILVPSRELALQIEQVFKGMRTGFTIHCFYGGHATHKEKKNLQTPPALLVGTPGKIAYHLQEQNLNPATIQTLVLDEFDKSLEYGFETEMGFIVGQLPAVKKHILTSATNLEKKPNFLTLKNPVTLNFLHDQDSSPDLQIKAVTVFNDDKLYTLYSLLCKIGNKPTLVFCNQRDAVEEVSSYLTQKGLKPGIFHGGLEQPDRERALLKFRNGTSSFMVSTDLAARGLDIPEIEFVVHYQLADADTFTHRNGRTARMKAHGTAYVILHPGEAISYLPAHLPTENLIARPVTPGPSPWETLYISAGKKDKISKGDVAGFLLQKGQLEKSEVGLIVVEDHAVFVAVTRKKITQLLPKLEVEKLKGKRIKIEIAN